MNGGQRWHFLLVASLLVNIFLLTHISKREGAVVETFEKPCPKCPTCPPVQKFKSLISRLLIPTPHNIPPLSDPKQSIPNTTSHQVYETPNVRDCSNKKIVWNTVGEVGNQFGCHLKQLLDWIYSLKTKEKHVFSQHGEDGVTEAIFQKIGEGTKYFVEFGVQDGKQCNTRYLREKYNWTGLLMDGGFINQFINLHKEMIWVDNVVDLFKKYKVPIKFDYLSEDTDFADLWLIKAILDAGYRPRVMIIEINGNHAPHTSLAVPSAAAKAHGMLMKDTRFYGTSALSLAKMVHKYGYQAVYVEKSSGNIFFIHKSELHNTDVALAHWMKVISEESRIGQADHPVQDPTDAHSHICADLPCDSSMDW